MKVSINDSSPIAAGSSAVDAFRTTRRLAELADQAGYHRYWLTELHGVPTNANASPEVAMAAVADDTTMLRVGSGAVLLNQRSPYRVAETFMQLHAMFPGRIDLGLGRATSGTVIDFALQQSRAGRSTAENYDEQVVELLRWFDGFEDSDPFADVPFFDDVPGRPEVWILGSTPSSAVVAARLGLRYCFAAFLNPLGVHTSLATYHREFQPPPLPSGVAAPHSMVAINVVCAETDEQARLVQAPGVVVRRQAASGRLPHGVPSSADAVRELGGLPEATQYVEGSWPRSVAAAPDRLRDILDSMVTEVAADELMIQDLIAEPEDRLASYRLIADTLRLESGGALTSGAAVQHG